MVKMLDYGCVVLVWNQPQLLEYTLEQLKTKSVVSDIVVVDDASGDDEMAQQKSTSQQFGASYIYMPSYPKLFRKTMCASEGLKHIKNEYVGILDVHGHYDDDYFEKCFSVVSRYKNLLVTNHWYWLAEWIDDVRNGKLTPCHLDGTKCECGGLCIDWKCYCTLDNIFPTPWGRYADGNFFMRREGAERYYDRNVIGFGFDPGSISWSAIKNGQSVCILGDVHSYHIKHNKSMILVNGGDRTKGYLRFKQFFWNLPPDNGLILVEGIK